MFQRLLHSAIATVLLLAALIFFVTLAWRLYPLYRQNANKIAHTTKELEEIKAMEQELEKKSAYFKTDAYLERQVRLKLNYKKPNEKVVFVYPDQYPAASKSDQSSRLTAQALTKTNWQKWLKYLIGK